MPLKRRFLFTNPSLIDGAKTLAQFATQSPIRWASQHVTAAPNNWIAFDDLKVNPRLESPDGTDLGTHLGLPLIRDEEVRKCSDAFILSLLDAEQRGYGGIRYSRDSNRYRQKRFGDPKYWKLRTACRAVGHLESATGAIRHERQNPCHPAFLDDATQQSRLIAGAEFFQPALLEAYAQLPKLPDERIILRGADREPLPLYEHPIIRETEAFLEQYDHEVSRTDIRVCHPKVQHSGEHTFYVPYGEKFLRRLSTQQRYPRRIFSRELNSGGRFYHVFWCAISSTLRRGILINGDKTSEHDFNACHPTLAHWAVGCDTLPRDPITGDLYTIRGYDKVDRSVIKIAFQIQLNARSAKDARFAIAKLFCGDGLRYPRKHHLDLASEVMSRIEDRYPAIGELWYSGAGLTLQFVDSEIVRTVLTDLMEEYGILGLSVHDSIIVAQQHYELLVARMEATFNTFGAQLAYDLFSSHRQRGICKQEILTVEQQSAPRVGDVSTTCEPYPKLETSEGPTELNLSVSRGDLERANRWSLDVLPTIVPVGVARPWEHEDRGGKSKWFRDTPDKVDRQVRALKALIAAGNTKALSKVASELSRVRYLRTEFSGPFPVPVDELIERLDAVLASAEAKVPGD